MAGRGQCGSPLPELADEDVDDLLPGLVHPPVKMSEKHLLRYCAPLAERKQFQDLVLLRRKLWVASCNFSSLLIEVDNEVTATNHDIRLAGRPTHDRSYAGDKLVLVKGLCQIVVRAKGQCLNLVRHIGKP